MLTKVMSGEIIKDPLFFADVFAGCGGISLGMINAGWKGSFAIEKNSDAFHTLKHNLIDKNPHFFDWPSWLPLEPISTCDLIQNYTPNLLSLKGRIHLLTGGPPCQGFSMAGRRVDNDPRNSLTEEYIQLVEKLEPRVLLIENVRGFTVPFRNDNGKADQPYSTKVKRCLESIGYKTFSEVIDLSMYGVPQSRHRFFLIAIRQDDPIFSYLGERSPFDVLSEIRNSFLSSRGLPTERCVTVKEAIGDLETAGKALVDNLEAEGRFKEIAYVPPNNLSGFVKLMRAPDSAAPTCLRLPKHRVETLRRFSEILATCQKGRTLRKEDRERLKSKKHALTPLHPDLPSATITTLPDDIIHYSEPRVLTVRENARLQSFPDWYHFTGNYTTGSKQRRYECPRYTQVGNAVPPLFSEAIGLTLKTLISGGTTHG